MHTWHLGWAYFKTYFYSTVRNVPALFFTLIFPPLMLVLSSASWGHSLQSKMSLLIIFFNYGVQTVAFMLLGMGVSQDRHTDWSHYLQTLPVSVWPMVIGRVLHTIIMCSINLISISLVALFVLDIHLPIVVFSYFVIIACLGIIPMTMMGLAIGYCVGPDSARSVFTLLNLLLLFGSFALPDHGLGGFVRLVLPTYQWFVLSYRIVDPSIAKVLWPILCLCLYSFVFFALFEKAFLKVHHHKRKKAFST